MSRALAWALAIAMSAATSWVACGSEPAEPGAAGGADAGGSGGTSFGGGGGVIGGSGGATGGSGGSDSGTDWGAAPKWIDTGLVAAGCPIERLANPKEITALVWKPCAWAKDCEEAVFNPELMGADAAFNPTSAVHDTGVVARIALAVVLPQPRVIVLDAAGSALGGFRTPPSATECWLPTASVSGKRLAVMAGVLGTEHGGVLDDHDAPGKAPKVFTLQNPPYGGAQGTPLGESRWLWWWVPVDRFSTVSAVDGSDFVMFAKAGTGQTLMLNAPTSAGSIFLFNEVRAVGDAGQYQRVIAWSDGKIPPQTYLQPTEPSDDYGYAGFANSVVGFFKGIGRKDLNLFDSVELWSTPFSTDPSKLAPKKIAPLDSKSMSTAWASGFGRMAFPSFAPPHDKQEILVWNLETGQHSSQVLPLDRNVGALLGVSRHHVYIAAAKPNTGPSAYLIRYPVP